MILGIVGLLLALPPFMVALHDLHDRYKRSGRH